VLLGQEQKTLADLIFTQDLLRRHENSVEDGHKVDTINAASAIFSKPMSKLFDAKSQVKFAALSGDFNPIHMDAIAARRTQAGAPVVHGIHSLLWLLDHLAERDLGLLKATSLKVRFRKFLYIGDRAKIEILQITPTSLRAGVLVDGAEVVDVSIGFGPSPRAASLPFRGTGAIPIPVPSSPVDLSLNQIQGHAGRLSFASTPAEAEKMFPHAARYLGAQRTAALACLSCLVGMVVPGLHSLFAGLELSICDDQGGAAGVEFAVTSVDKRFRLVRIAVRGGGLSGSLETICRPGKVSQPTIAQIAPSVVQDEFLGSTALIVGGSRGLGELTAKLIAAGGARVIVTYTKGKADADAVCAEIREWGGFCESAAYDVRQKAASQLAALKQTPTHVYYFATPTIFRRKRKLFDPHRFEEFNSFYLTGFLELVEACLRLRPEGISVFFPSTVFVESRPAEMTEYAMSKAAGEVLCADLRKFWRGARVLARRLPPLPTDQTNSLLVPMETVDPLHLILPIVRDMQKARTVPTVSA